MGRFGWLAAAVLLAILLVIPVTRDMSVMNVLIKACIASVFALGFNLLWGQAGLLSFGHAAYFGIGTFGAIYLMEAIDGGFAFPTPLVPLGGALVAFVFGLIAGWFATIRSGVYFAMITVALAELIAALSQKWDSLFGGEAGVRSIRSAWGPFKFQSITEVYYLVLFWTALTVIFLLWLQRSPLGLVIRGIREREERVQFLGYHSHAVKTVVFAVSAAVSGLAGGLLALSDEAANMVLFQGSGSAFVVLNTVIGGAGVFIGPIIGATLTTLFGYYVAGVTQFWMLYLGLLFIVLVLYAPTGLAGLVSERWSASRKAGTARLSGANVSRACGAGALMVAVVLAVELIGAVAAPQYAASGLAGVATPLVRVFWIEWSPLSLGSFLTIAAFASLGVALLRFGARDQGWSLFRPRLRLFRQGLLP